MFEQILALNEFVCISILQLDDNEILTRTRYVEWSPRPIHYKTKDDIKI